MSRSRRRSATAAGPPPVRSLESAAARALAVGVPGWSISTTSSRTSAAIDPSSECSECSPAGSETLLLGVVLFRGVPRGGFLGGAHQRRRRLGVRRGHGAVQRRGGGSQERPPPRPGDARGARGVDDGGRRKRRARAAGSRPARRSRNAECASSADAGAAAPPQSRRSRSSLAEDHPLAGPRPRCSNSSNPARPRPRPRPRRRPPRARAAQTRGRAPRKPSPAVAPEKVRDERKPAGDVERLAVQARTLEERREEPRGVRGHLPRAFLERPRGGGGGGFFGGGRRGAL